MVVNLIKKIIGGILVVSGTALAVNAYPALFHRLDEWTEETRIHQDYRPKIRLSDFLIGETGLTYGISGALAGAYLLSNKNKKNNQ